MRSSRSKTCAGVGKAAESRRCEAGQVVEELLDMLPRLSSAKWGCSRRGAEELLEGFATSSKRRAGREQATGADPLFSGGEADDLDSACPVPIPR